MASERVLGEVGTDIETMSATTMTRLLGVWSSHPRHALSRLFAWCCLAAVPIIGVAAVIVWWLSRDINTALTLFIDHGCTLVVLGIPAVAFAVSLGLTAATATSAARSAAFVADSQASRRTVAGILGLILLVGSLTWVVPLVVGAPPTVRTFVALFGLVPLVFLFLLPVMLQVTRGDEARVFVSRWWCVALPAAVAVVGLLSRVHIVADTLASLPIADRIICLVVDAMPSSESAGSIPSVVRGWIVTGIVCLIAVPVMAASLALLDAIRDGVRRSQTARDARLPTQTATAPDWISLVAEQVDPEHLSGDWQPQPFVAESLASPSSPADVCNVFFADGLASVDQAAGFREITSRANEICADTSSGAWWDYASGDLVIEGPRGSGRTAVAVASIIHAVLVRGDTVLVLVPSSSKRKSLVKRIKRAASGLGVGHLVHVSEVSAAHAVPCSEAHNLDDGQARTAAAVDAQAGGSNASSPRRPQVIIGTLADFEDHFFADAPSYDRLRVMLCSIGLVIVEDIDRFATQARIHLPFVLAKLRLLLATDGFGCQTVVTAPPLADAARSLVERQLLSTGIGLRPGVRLRPIALPPDVAPAWVIRLTPPIDADGTADGLVEACATACIEAGIDAVVYSPLLSATDLEAIEQRTKADSGLRIRAIAEIDDLDAIVPADHGRVAAALRAAGHGAAVGLARVGGRTAEAPVVFAVSSPTSRLIDRDPDHGLMVLPGRECPTLFSQHFCSVARFIKPLRPAPRGLWTALGLPQLGELEELRSAAFASGAPYIDRIISLDPADSAAAVPSPALWPWATVASQRQVSVPAPQPVAIDRTVDTTMCIVTDSELATVTVMQRSSDALAVKDAEHRTLAWLGSDGSELGRGDLAYTNSLRFEGLQRIFVPSRIDDSGRGVVRIHVRPWSTRDAAGQAFMPCYDIVDLAFPPRLTVAPALLSSQLPHRVGVFVLVHGNKPHRSRVKPLLERQFVSLRLRGIYDEIGIVRPCDAMVRYEAAKFLVLFDSPSERLIPELVREDFLVPWGEGRPADREIIPELGAAFTFAMRWQAAGLEKLVRCIGVGVRDAESRRRRMGLIFFEPRSTESSGFALMEPIVSDRAVMSEFFGAAAWLLERCQASARPAATLYSHAESCINPQIDGRMLTVDPASISDTHSLLRSIADEAIGRP